MSKSIGFIILSLLVVASTESILISSSNVDQESKPYASFSTNSAASPESGSCSGRTITQCIMSLENYDLLPPSTLVIGHQ